MRIAMVMACAVLAGCSACTAHQDDGQPALPPFIDTITEIDSPATGVTAQPQLFASADGVVFSWMEALQDERHVLRWSEYRDGSWSPAGEVVAGTDYFVNWADVPSVYPLSGGRLVAHWLYKTAPDTYAYHVGLKISDRARRTWSDTVVPHTDRTPTEHGFVSFFELSAQRFGLIWLDGRDFDQYRSKHGGGVHDKSEPEKGVMALRSTTYAAAAEPELVVDDRVCECCPTAAARTKAGAIVAYRNRTENEVRDIYVSRYENGAWTKGVPIHDDNWQISGCPVNGPALASSGDHVALVWFSAADNDARVLAKFSADGGKTFGDVVRVSEGVALGRVDVAMLPDASALAMWIDYNDGNSQLRVRRITADGEKSASVTVTSISDQRASGSPRLAVYGDRVLFAWSDAVAKKVRVAKGQLRRLS